jgi:hypothetical protein
MSNPSDLNISPQPDTDKNFFNFKAVGLKIGTPYAIKFQWVYEDGTVSEWSPGKNINTFTENVPSAPSATVPTSSTGNIPVTLSAFPTNAKRVDIYVIGGATYGTGKVVDSFFAAGTKTISITEPGVYQVVLIAVTPSGINGDPTNTFTITVSGSSVDTTVIPGAPTSVTVTGFNEPSDPLNRTGYANISFTAGTGSRGHSIGLWTSIPGSTDPVRVIPADGTSTKIEGLFVGQSYYFRVRSFNEFNNPSAWVAPSSNYPVTIPGSALVPGRVTVSGSAAPKSIVVSWGDPASNASLVTSGGYYEVKLYTNSGATGTPLETRKSWSNQASFSGLTTGTSYWVTVQPYTAGSTPVAGTVSLINGPLVPTAIDNPDLKEDFILASNQLQVGGTSGANDIHLSAYTKTVGSLSTSGRIYIGGPETSTSVAVGIYNDSGTPFYADNLGRFSLGDKLTWSGNLSTPQLNVKGTIDVTGASTFSSYVLAGATNSAFIGIGYQVPYRLSNVLQSGSNGLTGIVINSSGTVTNSDYIKSDGTFRLANGALTFTGGTLAVSGNITANSLAANTSLSGLSITGTSGTIGGITLNSSGLSSTNFSISSTGLITANGGTIGGWTINTTQLRSSATDGTGKSYISLNPGTPKIALVTGATFSEGSPIAAPGLTGGGIEAITIDTTSGIKGPNVTIAGNNGPGFWFKPDGEAVIRGTIYASAGIFSGNVSGANITMTGSATQYGTTSSRIFFEDSNYAANSGTSTFEYQNNTGSFDIDGEWISSTNTVVVTNNDVRFTDATLAGGVPSSSGTFSYGELWLGSGNSTGSGTVDLWANYPGDYIGISIVADKTTQNITIKGPSSAGFTTVHRSSSNIQILTESPAMLQVDSSGRLTRGRSIFTGGASTPSVNIGLTGDLYFSTAT